MTTNRSLLGCAALTVALTVGLAGCGKYPRLTSQNSLHLVLALRTACNTKNADRLAKVEDVADRQFREGKVPEPEMSAIRDIIAVARAGKWETAEQRCLAFQRDQVR